MKSFEYGELNTLLDKRSRPNLMEDANPTTLIKDAIKKANTDSDISPGPYKGVVLRVDKPPKKSWVSSLYDKVTGSEVKNYFVLKVRVPELDAHIPEPKSYANEPSSSGTGDYELIDLHRSYYPRELGPEPPTAGEIVWVDFLNGKNVYIKKFRTSEAETVNPPAKPGAKGTKGNKGNSNSKGKGSGGGKGKPKPTPNATELEKWKARSGQGNPRGIDIITKTVNGREVTLRRPTMAKYENFVTEMLSRTNEVTAPMIHRVLGESFRIYNPSGGKWFSKGQNGTHNFGNAIDLRIPAKYRKPSPERRAYVDMVISTAQKNGFIRFGVGNQTIHMDTGEVGSSVKRAFWWAYVGGTAVYQKQKKKYANNNLSTAWHNKEHPPDLKSFDYKSYNY